VDQLRHLTTFDVKWDGKAISTKAWCGVVEGLPVYMLEPQEPLAFFWRGRFYGEVGGRSEGQGEMVGGADNGGGGLAEGLSVNSAAQLGELYDWKQAGRGSSQHPAGG
jgi:hypothetical protein